MCYHIIKSLLQHPQANPVLEEPQMRMRTSTYKRKSIRTYGNRAGILAVHAAVCLVVFFVLFGAAWYFFGPFEPLRASGWPVSPMQTAQATPTPTPAPSETPQPSASQASTPSAQAALPYVQVRDIAQGNFKGKLMVVSDPSKITVGVTPFLGDVGAPLSGIVQAAGAAGGVNAGSIEGYNGTGGNPEGIVIADGKTVYQQEGKTSFQVTGFGGDNKLVVSAGATFSQIGAMNLRCAVSAGPVLIADGKAAAVTDDSVDPRTAIGQTQDGTVLLLVIDGRQQGNAGADLKSVQQILLQNGASVAVALDGGSSTTMNYLGKTLNSPCNISGERYIATAFLVMPGGESNAG